MLNAVPQFVKFTFSALLFNVNAWTDVCKQQQSDRLLLISLRKKL